MLQLLIAPITPVIMLGVLFSGYWLYTHSAVGSSGYIVGKKLLVPYGNLGLLFWLLLWKLWPGIQKSLQERSQRIAEAVRDFDSREDAIFSQYKEIEEKLAGVEAETAEILDRASSSARNEAVQALVKAEQRAERIRTDAEQLAGHESLKVQQEVQRLLVERAFRQAETLLAEQMNDEAQAGLQQDFLTKLGADQ